MKGYNKLQTYVWQCWACSGPTPCMLSVTDDMQLKPDVCPFKCEVGYADWRLMQPDLTPIL